MAARAPLLVQGFSQRLSLSESGVHPHQPRSSFTAPADLNEDEVSGFPRPAHLVSVPGHGGVLGVDRVADLQPSDGLVPSASLEHEDVLPDNLTSGTNVFGKNVHCPGRN